jgi:hypothetical protein
MKDLVILGKEGNKVISETPSPTIQENSLVGIKMDGREENLDVIVCFINEKEMLTCPHIEIKLNSELTVSAICDTGSDANLLNEQIYDQLIERDIKIPTLPLENVALVTAFGKHTRRIKKQALIEFKIGEDVFETVFLIAHQLTNQAILGHQFAR